MKKRKLTTALIASGLVATSFIGLGASAFAADSNGSTPQSKAPTAAEIAQHDAERKTEMENRLTQEVKDGKITAEQKTAILSFFADNKPAKPSETSTEAERKAAMDDFKGKVDAFAKSINVDVSLIVPAHHGGPGGPGAPGGTPPTPAEIKAHQEEQLSAAVKAGTITQAQKTTIEKFFADNQPSINSSQTEEQRHAAMDAFKTKVESFASTNNIPLDVLRPGRPIQGGDAHQ